MRTLPTPKHAGQGLMGEDSWLLSSKPPLVCATKAAFCGTVYASISSRLGVYLRKMRSSRVCSVFSSSMSPVALSSSGGISTCQMVLCSRSGSSSAHPHSYAHTHKLTHSHIHTDTQHTHTHTHAHAQMHTCTHKQKPLALSLSFSLFRTYHHNTNMYTRACVCICVGCSCVCVSATDKYPFLFST